MEQNLDLGDISDLKRRVFRKPINPSQIGLSTDSIHVVHSIPLSPEKATRLIMEAEQRIREASILAGKKVTCTHCPPYV